MLTSLKNWIAGHLPAILVFAVFLGTVLYMWGAIQQDAVDRAAVNTEKKRYEQQLKEYKEANRLLIEYNKALQQEKAEALQEKERLEKSNYILRQQNEKLARDYRAAAAMLPVRPDF